MKRFYKVSDSIFMSIGYDDTNNKWYAELIDTIAHKIIATNSNSDKIKVIANIVNDNWFGAKLENFALFIADILKY